MIFLVEDKGRTFVVIADNEAEAREVLADATYVSIPVFEEYKPSDNRRDIGIVIEVTEGSSVLYP